MAHLTDEQINQLFNDVTEIKIALKGYNGFPGLCESHHALAKDYYNFKRWVIGVACFAVGSGILSAAVIKFL